MSVSKVNSPPTMNTLISKINEIIDALNSGGGGSGPSPASITPLMDGTADVGSSYDYARADHVHPSDTSRVPTDRTVNGKALSADITLDADDVEALPASNGTATNLDNATQTGFYSYSSSATNAPVSANGTLLVFRTSSTYQFQLAFPNNSSGNPVIYTRIHRSAGWGAWKTLSYS